MQCLAMKANAWDTVRAANLMRTRPSPTDIESFVRTYQDDEVYQTPILPTEISIAMIRLGK